METFIYQNQDFSNKTAPIVSAMLDWRAANKYEGKNITAAEWAALPQKLRQQLEERCPGLKTDSDIFNEFDMLLTVTRNLNTVNVVAHDIVQAHILAHETGNRGPLDKIKRLIERRVAYAEKYVSGGVSHDPLFHVAGILDTGDMLGVGKKLDVVEGQRSKRSGHAPRLK